MYTPNSPPPRSTPEARMIHLFSFFCVHKTHWNKNCSDHLGKKAAVDGIYEQIVIGKCQTVPLNLTKRKIPKDGITTSEGLTLGLALKMLLTLSYQINVFNIRRAGTFLQHMTRF